MTSKQAQTVKKSLVRNAELPTRKTVVVKPTQSSTKQISARSDAPKSSRSKSTSSETELNLNKPELNSTLKLSKKIDDIVNARRIKSCSDVDSTKLAADEKISRQVNFPYDRAIYKDLIPLTSEKCSSQPMLSSRPPLPHKDKEPILSDFVEPKKTCNYYFLPSVNIETPLSVVKSDNLRLYRILRKKSVDRCSSQEVLLLRPPVPHKNKEPVLSDFVEPKKDCNYYILTSVNIETQLCCAVVVGAVFMGQAPAAPNFFNSSAEYERI
nr:unnamed protein product [Callosobruchus chinensis]